MKRILSVAAVIAALGAHNVPALAADLDVIQNPGYTDVEYGSGWYLRGDIGYTASQDAELSFFSSSRFAYDHQSTNDNVSFTFGVGHTFNDFFRADITYDYSTSSEWSGSTSGSSCGGAFTGDCFSADQAEFDLQNTMVNAYVNLGHFGKFSPYVGAGIGAAYVDWTDYSTTPTCVLDPGEDCAHGVHSGGAGTEVYTGPTTALEGASGYALSYAFMAGFDYRLNHNWLVDFGYRYTHVDSSTVLEASRNSLNGDSVMEDLSLHEFRAGFRYEIW